jgi:two-component sensor histidine kinase
MSDHPSYPRSDLHASLAKNLRLLIALERLKEREAPLNPSAAMARTAGRLLTLNSIYDVSLELCSDGFVPIDEWIRAFIDSITRGLGGSGSLAYVGGLEARISLETAQSLGPALGELVAEAFERSLRAEKEPRIEVDLIQAEGGCFELRVRDASDGEQGSYRFPA